MKGADQLLVALRRHGMASGEELRKALGVSQSTLSRLIRDAGPSVCRLGRARATRYALAREIPGLGRQVPVYRVSEAGAVDQVGVLHFLTGERYWLEGVSGDGHLYPNGAPFISDMRPQGYIGRAFPSLHPELKLPSHIDNWGNDHSLIAVALRGEDCVGNLIVGEESFNRFYAYPPVPRTREDYTALAAGALKGHPGSSAGGEHPKFSAYTDDRHLLVKFTGGDGAAADRWRDLLVCEHAALEVLREAGIPSARSDWFDLAGGRFLEIERFDRIGKRGRRGVVSLLAVGSYYLGDISTNWSKAARDLLVEPSVKFDAGQAMRLIWLDTFGELIANTDRHFGNVSFFAEEEAEHPALTLTPVYDMLPMAFAPKGASIPQVAFSPRPPTAINHGVWHDAAHWALRFWDRACTEGALSSDFRHICVGCRDALAVLTSEV